MGKILHIRFAKVQIEHQNGMEQSYFSISFRDREYFSSCFDHNNGKLGDDVLLQLSEGTVPQSIILQRWQNCMIIFRFEVEIGQLRSRSFTKKKIYTKHQELLSLQFQIYESKDMLFTSQYLQNVSQHYLIIEDLYFAQQKNVTRASKQPNFFTITTQQAHYTLPVRGAVVIIKLPDSLEISSFINSFFNGKSSFVRHEKIANEQQINLQKEGKSVGKVVMKIRWAVNLHRCQVDQNVLLQSNEMMLYDLELRFDNPADVVGCRFKITHGNKAFDFVEDVNQAKVTKIKKVIFFLIKTEAQEVQFVMTKGGKLFSHCRLNTSQLVADGLTIIKKKWADLLNPNKFYGYIKARGQRGRNLSVPQNNRYWRQVLRRKHSTSNMLLSIHQMSVYYSENEPLYLVGKVDSEQKTSGTLTNLNFYEDQDEPSKQVMQFGLKGQESAYLVVKGDPKNVDFCGIGVVNSGDLRLGINACQIGLFKNQQKIGTINCLINKMVFWPFPKPFFQSETQLQNSQNQYIDIFLNQINFSAYFYTYRYDGKQEVYCIVQANRSKKVLILQNSEHDELSFFAAAGSDSLNYEVDQPDVIKIKLSFLVSDLGHEQEIYGSAVCKVKGADVLKENVKLKNVQICNDYAVTLGYVNLQVSKGIPPKSSPKMATPENQREKPSVVSFDLSQASFDTNRIGPPVSGPSRRYSGGYINSPKPVAQHFLKKNTHPGKQIMEVKLPVIKQKKDKDNFSDLLQMMRVRKRGMGGAYDEKGLSTHKQSDVEVRRQRHSFDLQKLQQTNPNIERNLQILFPKKGNEKQIQMVRSKQNDYEDRLRGLKSVMKDMNDIGEVQPSIRQSQHQLKYQQQQSYEPEPEWEGNQFVSPYP